MKSKWMYEVTPTQVKRFESDCQYYAEEPVTAELIRNVLYAYGSELACRRIRDTYGHTDKSKISFGYSENLGTWFFGLTIEGL
jgi:hypothetical protein